MPIQLPPGLTPQWRARSDDQVLTAGTRVTAWRFELLDRREVLIGDLEGVQPGGSVDFSASASIKGGGSITIVDIGQDIDWLNVRIRPVCTIEGLSREIPVGVWLPSAPTEDWSDLGRSWSVDLLDKASILDGDIWTHPSSGNPEAFVAKAGQNVISVVRSLITQTGESVRAIENASVTLSSDRVFEAGMTRLQIINELLDSAGFFSLWVDYAGQFRATPYAPPADRSPAYDVAAPFTAGDTSVMSPDFSRERDIFSVPNKVFCSTSGDGETEALTSVATNTDPNSPYSYPSRGRWITQIESDVDAVSQSALDLITRRKLADATAVTSKLELTHLFLPDLLINTTIRARNDRAGIDQLCTVTNTSVSFDPLGTCSTKLQEVPL